MVQRKYRAIPYRFIVVAAILESLYLLLLLLGDLRQYLVEAILLLLGSGLFYLVSVYFLQRNSDRPHTPSRRSLTGFILLSAVMFRLTAWPLFPAFSDDPYRYRWEGKVQALGENPYQIRPSDPQAAHLRDSTFLSLPGRDFKAAYGPLIELIQHATYRGVAAFTSDPLRQVFWFKLPSAVFDLGILVALLALTKVYALPSERVLIYAWCPLPVIEFWGTGHNDAIAVFFVVLAFVLAAKERWTGAFVMLSLGAAAKFWPLLLFPAFAGWRGWRPERWREPLIALPVFALLSLPYWSGVTENVRFLSGFIGGWRNNDSFFGVLLWIAGGDFYHAKYMATGLICIVALAVMWLRVPLVKAWLAVTAAILLISANSHAWYLTWMFPALVVVPFTPFLLWVVLAPLAHHVVIDWAVLGEWRGSTPLRWLIYASVYGWLLVEAVRALLRRRAADTRKMGRAV